MPPLTLSNLGSGAEVESNDSFELKKNAVRFALGQALFHPTPRLPVRGDGRMMPSDEQFKPLNALSHPWLAPIIGPAEEFESFKRSTLLIADEGGMGKTYSCSIALNWLREKYAGHGGSVLVICPPTLISNWVGMLEKFGYRVNYINGLNLAEGSLKEGINITSTYALQAPLAPQIKQRLSGKLTAVLLDEAHNGMIAAGDLMNRLSSVLSVAKTRLLVTATPMRSGIGDLFALLRSGCAGTNDEQSCDRIEEIYQEHQQFILADWIPVLNRLKINAFTDEDIDLIQEHWARILPMTDEEEDLLRPLFQNLAVRFADFTEEELIQLAQDLHPIGRFSSCTLRDDLGHQRCETLYRQKRSRTLGYTLSADYYQVIEAIKAQQTEEAEELKLFTVLESCLMNVSSGYAAFADQIFDDELILQCRDVFSNDQRLNHLRRVFLEEIEQQGLHPAHSRAVVIFCHLNGTIGHLQTLLEEHPLFEELNLTIHAPTKPDEDEQQDRYCIKSRALRKTLEKIGTDAQKTDTLQVVLCGMGVSEGHNMNWATHIVHWYMPTNSAEELAQKNWRLDRRVNGEWENLPISRRFSITYLVNEQRDTRQNLNDRFSRNRRFLGHRRFIAENEDTLLAPILDDEWLERQWTEQPQGHLAPSSYAVQRLLDYLEGRISDHNGLASDFSNTAFLSSLRVHLDQDDMYEEGLELGQHMGYDPEDFHVCLRMADRNERLELMKFTPNIGPLQIISRWGVPGGEGALFGVEPTGTLFQKMLNLCLGICEVQGLFTAQDYPFSFNGKGPSYLIHKGVLDVLNGEAGFALREHWGDNLPTALYRCNSHLGETMFEPLRLSEIKDPENLVFFEQMRQANNEVRIPLDDIPFMPAVLIEQQHIRDYVEALRPQYDQGDNLLVYLQATQRYDANANDLPEQTPSMLIPVLRHSKRRYPDDASTMYIKMEKGAQRTETQATHGWW